MVNINSSGDRTTITVEGPFAADRLADLFPGKHETFVHLVCSELVSEHHIHSLSGFLENDKELLGQASEIVRVISILSHFCQTETAKKVCDKALADCLNDDPAAQVEDWKKRLEEHKDEQL